MIAYYAQPNRFHPALLKIIKQKYKNFKAVFNHFIIENEQYAFHLSNHQVEHITLERILQVKDADFFSGVLHPKYNFLLQPEFSFTVISEPVNRVYQLYYIFKFFEREYNKEKIVQKIFENKQPLTMEYFIDSLLANSYYKNIIMEHIFLLPKEIECLDFIGIAEENETTKSFLQKKLNINLTNFCFAERIDTCIYRKNDITKSLEEQIDRYNKLRVRLKML